MRRQEIQTQVRRQNPQLNDLLNPDQINAARSGNIEQLTALFAYIDLAKRPVVASLLPGQSLAAMRELRREGQRLRTPRQVASEDLKEAKVFRAVYSNRQLEEVLVDFWFNHFNVDVGKNVAQVPIHELEKHGLRSMLISAIETATHHSESRTRPLLAKFGDS